MLPSFQVGSDAVAGHIVIGASVFLLSRHCAFPRPFLPRSPEIRKACEFLLSKQRADGGWGESYKSCETKQWLDHEEAQVVNTAWAIMALCKAEWPDPKPIERGVQVLLAKQEPNGDWDQQSISGVFNGNCMISYSNYRNIFPIWALGRYMNYVKKRKAQGLSN